MDTLQYWYDRGIRIYKFDFVDFGAVTADTAKKLSPEEIHRSQRRYVSRGAETIPRTESRRGLVAFNGFGGDVESTAGAFPFHNLVDLRWLEVFDSMYSGDPRPSDVPEMDFWRSMDVYSDHMVRRYEQSFLPLERIDSTGFMLGNTGTIYYRKTHAWKGALILMMARGGWGRHGLRKPRIPDRRRCPLVRQSPVALSAVAGQGKDENLWWDSRGCPALWFRVPGCRWSGLCRNEPGTESERIRVPRLSSEQPAVLGGELCSGCWI